ncbi:MAG: helicase [Chloroflexota bacterium]
MLLTDKLNEIARTLGKVDEHGNVTEDLRGQILGQLNDRLSYDQLYRQALSDPELKRTRQELEAAMSNASEARKVVFELFQDLDRFSLDDYRPLADIDESKFRILEFLRQALPGEGGSLTRIDEKRFAISMNSAGAPVTCTLDRELAQQDDSLILMGIDHPMMNTLIKRWKTASPDILGATGRMNLDCPAVLTVWLVQSFGRGSDAGSQVIPIAIDSDGKRVPSLEKQYQACFSASPGHPSLEPEKRFHLLHDYVEPTLQRELRHRGIASPEKGYSTELLAWVEIV